MYDFEDITFGRGPGGIDYIYVGDIGNNWEHHCRGITDADYKVYRFPEPNISKVK